MSFVHFLTIGRFGFGDETPLPEHADRAVWPPEEPSPIERPMAFLIPWATDELQALEAALRERYALDLDLEGGYLTNRGLLSARYTGCYELTANPLASVAIELFGAQVSERGMTYDAAGVHKQAEEDHLENQRRRAITGLCDPHERLKAVVEAVGTGLAHFVAERMISEISGEVVPELTDLLHSRHQYLACAGLREAGIAASAAAPDLASLLLAEPDGQLAYSIVSALAAIGPAAEEGLVAATRCPRVEATALQALAKLAKLSEPTRARLQELSQGEGQVARLAAHALGRSTIATRVARLRESRTSRDLTSCTSLLEGRLERGQVDKRALRFAAHLGHVPSHLILMTSESEAETLKSWGDEMPSGENAWIRYVAATALDAQATALLPRSSVMSQAFADEIRAGEVSEGRLLELLEEHDWATVPGANYQGIVSATSASRSSGSEQFESLSWLLGSLDREGLGEMFFLFLEEHTIPLVLGERPL